jgi:hypothetical protein
MRVTHYQATVYHTSTGSTSTQQHAFTQQQADEVGGVLEPDGLGYRTARILCERWTRRGQYGDIRYSYTTLTEDDIRFFDQLEKDARTARGVTK